MTTTEHQAATFADLGVSPPILEALTKIGITHPFPIQAMALPVALGGHDIIGQAKTGTGKTLGFGIPVLQQVTGPGEPGWDELPAPGKPQALIVVPTRELAVQVAGDLSAAGRQRPVRVLTVYGGRAYDPQVEALKRGVEIVVGTPGRLLDLAQQSRLDLRHARRVVLDEADEMLDLGFLPDVERLLSMTPAGRQTMLFSATMPSAVVALAKRYMTQPTHIRAADPDDTGATVKATAQYVYRAHSLDKVEMIARLLQAEGRGLTIVFSRTKRTAANVAEELADRGFAAAAIHGDLGQGAREQALRAFRNGKVDVLVATDVAARGIDVDDVTHVINYQCPEDEKTYLHRIGRTGRAGNTGIAVTLVDWEDLTRWSMIDKALDLGIPEPEETYSTSERFYSDLSIPPGTKGILPRAARTRAGLDAEVLEDLGETGGRTRRSSRRAPDAASQAPRPPRTARTVRQRRRTRGGKPIEASGEAGTALAVPTTPEPIISGDAEAGAMEPSGAAETGVTTAAPSQAPTQTPSQAPAGDAEASPRRRRRRGGRGRGSKPQGTGSSEDTGSSEGTGVQEGGPQEDSPRAMNQAG